MFAAALFAGKRDQVIVALIEFGLLEYFDKFGESEIDEDTD